jgi:hypothetical protein
MGETPEGQPRIYLERRLGSREDEHTQSSGNRQVEPGTWMLLPSGLLGKRIATGERACGNPLWLTVALEELEHPGGARAALSVEARWTAQLFANASGRNLHEFSTRPRSVWTRGVCP